MINHTGNKLACLIRFNSMSLIIMKIINVLITLERLIKYVLNIALLLIFRKNNNNPPATFSCQINFSAFIFFIIFFLKRLNKGYESIASTLVIMECQLEDLA